MYTILRKVALVAALQNQYLSRTHFIWILEMSHIIFLIIFFSYVREADIISVLTKLVLHTFCVFKITVFKRIPIPGDTESINICY